MKRGNAEECAAALIADGFEARAIHGSSGSAVEVIYKGMGANIYAHKYKPQKLVNLCRATRSENDYELSSWPEKAADPLVFELYG
jgi:hypothetical protein